MRCIDFLQINPSIKYSLRPPPEDLAFIAKTVSIYYAENSRLKLRMVNPIQDMFRLAHRAYRQYEKTSDYRGLPMSDDVLELMEAAKGSDPAVPLADLEVLCADSLNNEIVLQKLSYSSYLVKTDVTLNILDLEVDDTGSIADYFRFQADIHGVNFRTLALFMARATGIKKPEKHICFDHENLAKVVLSKGFYQVRVRPRRINSNSGN